MKKTKVEMQTYAEIKKLRNKTDAQIAENLSDEGCKQLYVAIWEKALEEELKTQKNKLYMDIIEVLMPNILLYKYDSKNSNAKIERCIKEQYGQQGVKMLEEIEKGIRQSNIESLVKDKVYRETLYWPECAPADKEYARKYAETKAAIMEVLSGE